MQKLDGYGRSQADYIGDLLIGLDDEPIALFELTSWGASQYELVGVELSDFLRRCIEFLLNSGAVVSYMYFDGEFNRWAPSEEYVNLGTEECAERVVKEWEALGDKVSDIIWFANY